MSADRSTTLIDEQYHYEWKWKTSVISHYAIHDGWDRQIIHTRHLDFSNMASIVILTAKILEITW